MTWVWRGMTLMGCLTLAFPVLAQWNNLRFTHLGFEKGLSALVYKITQDQSGFIYLGTNQGLIRYDGHNFEPFIHDPDDSTSIGPGRVRDVIVARNGTIWLTLDYGALLSLDPTTETFTEFELPDLPYHHIRHFQGLDEDHQGHLWMGAHHFRLIRFRPEAGTFDVFSPRDFNAQEHGGRLIIPKVVPDPTDSTKLWVSVLDLVDTTIPYWESTLYHFDKIEQTFEEKGLFGQLVNVDQQGHLLGLVWGNAITEYHPSTEEAKMHFYDIREGTDPLILKSRCIFQNKEKIWIGTDRGVIEYHGNGRFSELPGTAQMSQIQDIFEDNQGNFWFGGVQGIYVLDRLNQHVQHYSLSHLGIHQRIVFGRLTYDKHQDQIYLTTGIVGQEHLSRHLYRIPMLQQFGAADQVKLPHAVCGVVQDKKDNIWVATSEHGLHQFESSTNRLSRHSAMDHFPWVWSLNLTPDGWIVGYNSNTINFYHPQKGQSYQIHKDSLIEPLGVSRMHNHFSAFTILNDGRICIGANRLVIIDPNSRQVNMLHYDVALNPLELNLDGLAEDLDGNFWMGHRLFYGKFRLVNDSLILMNQIGVKDGLVQQEVYYAICDDQNRIWTFSFGGLNAIDARSTEVRHFGVDDGLPHSNYSPLQVITLPDQRLVTYGGNGIITFHPDSLWSANRSSRLPVVFKRVRVGGEHLPQSIEAPIVLNTGRENVDIEFQALAFPNDRDVTYRYRLLGLQNDWIDIGRNKLVTLPQLAPGKYRFEVTTGTEPDPNFIKSIDIHVPQPLTKRWWFIISVTAVLLGGMLFIYRWRIRQIRRQAHELTEYNRQIAELELKALRSQMNPHFMFNTLNSIKNYILQAEPRPAAQYLASFAHLIRMTLQYSREKYISLRQELEVLQLYVELEKLRFDGSFQFHCTVEPEVDLDQSHIPPMILQPFLENAIWHGLMPLDGERHLWMTFQSVDDQIRCVIEDNGIGREAAKSSQKGRQHQSMGMDIIRDRIDMINLSQSLGISIEVFDKYEGTTATGTRVRVCLPKILEEATGFR